MSGHHPISEFFDRFSPEEKLEIEAKKTDYSRRLLFKRSYAKPYTFSQKN
jgi:hypothetical protein